MDVDVGSSTTASSVVGLVAGAVKSLVIDMAIVLQARFSRTQPRACLACLGLAAQRQRQLHTWLGRRDMSAVAAATRVDAVCSMV